MNGLSVLPDGIHAIVISRAEPPQAFTGMIAGSKLHMIGWNELQLTPEESKDLVRLQGIDRPQRGLFDWMHEQTGGWAAGLVLLTERMKTVKIAPESPGMLPSEQIFDFFAGEVLDKLDSATRDFLLMTSFLPKMTAGAATELTGQDDAARILSDLSRNNFFTEKLRGVGPMYQYHQLFREFLLTRAKGSLNHEGIARIRKRAASILEASGQTEDAAELFMQAGAWKDLKSLILANAQMLVAQGRNKLLEKWITALPDELLDSDPWLFYWRGLCRMPFDPAEGRKCFEQSFRIFKDQNNTDAIVAWAAIVNAILHEWDDFNRMDPLIEWMENALKLNPAFVSPETEAIVSAGMFTALFRRRPDHASLTTWSERALQLTRKAPVSLFLQARMIVYWNAIIKGDRKKCVDLLDEIRDVLKKSSPSPFEVMLAKTMEAQGHIADHASAEKGLREVRESLSFADETGIHFFDHHLYAIGVYCALNKGNLELVGEYVAKGRMLVSEKQRDGLAQSVFLAGWHNLLTGNIATARSHAEQALNLSLKTGIPSSELFCRNLMAHVLIKEDAYQQASDEVAFAKKLAYRIGSEMLINRCLLAEAQIAFSRGDEKAGLKLLRDALALGKEIDLVSMLFHWQPAIMAELCARALENGIEVEYAKRTIRELRLVPEEPPFHLENWPWPVRIFTLGGFRLLVDDKLVTFSGKVQKKPLEMLKALVALGGRDVREEQLIDTLWPEADGDAARISFKTTLHRLRQLLGNDKVIQVQDGRGTLDSRYCWVDAWAFEKCVQDAEQQLRNADCGLRNEKQKPLNPKSAIRNLQSEIPQRLEKALQMYRGHFLGDENEKPWMISMGERLKNKFLRGVNLLGEYWHGQHELKNDRSQSKIRNPKSAIEKAIAAYERGLEVDDLAEELYQQLMVCYQKSGRRAEALRVYERCRKVLSTSLGVEPSQETEKIYQRLTGC